MNSRITIKDAPNHSHYFVYYGSTLAPREDLQSWEKKELINRLTKPAFKHFFPEGTVGYLGYTFTQGEEI